MPTEKKCQVKMPKKHSKFLQSYQGPASKMRRRCKQCYKHISRIKGREYAANKAKKVTTYCDRCKGQPLLCLTCFKKLHKKENNYVKCIILNCYVFTIECLFIMLR